MAYTQRAIPGVALTDDERARLAAAFEPMIDRAALALYVDHQSYHPWVLTPFEQLSEPKRQAWRRDAFERLAKELADAVAPYLPLA